MTYMDLMVPVMLLAGALGGMVNRLLLDPAVEKSLTWMAHILIGIAAAFTVPVLLNMISSSLIREVAGSLDDSEGLNNLLVLAGFCLLAAISARAFIHSLSERLLRLVNEANKNASEAKAAAEKAETIAELAAEPGEGADLMTESASESFAAAELTADQKDVLKAMLNSHYTMRTASGLARDSKIFKAEVSVIMEELLKRGLIRSTTGKQGQTLWYPTAAVRVAFGG